jgi:hypothetical protein
LNESYLRIKEDLRDDNSVTSSSQNAFMDYETYDLVDSDDEKELDEEI